MRAFIVIRVIKKKFGDFKSKVKSYTWSFIISILTENDIYMFVIIKTLKSLLAYFV